MKTRDLGLAATIAVGIIWAIIATLPDYTLLFNY